MALVAAGCDGFSFQGFLDQPIPIALRQGIPVTPVAHAGREFQAVIDTGSPFNVVERSGDGSRANSSLRLKMARPPGVTRFVFDNLELHDLKLGSTGVDQPLSFKARIGAPLLRRFSVSLAYGSAPTLTLSDAVPDTLAELAGECDFDKLAGADSTERCIGVFGASLVGGGVVEVGGELQNLSSTRLMLTTCLMPAPFDRTKRASHGAEATTGVPAVAWIATGFGTSIISRRAFERLRKLNPALKETPGAKLYLPGGSEAVSTTRLPRVALVSNETGELGPCGELALRRRLVIGGRAPLSDADRELLEDKGANGASVAYVAADPGVRFAILRDSSPLLQGIRREVQPFVAVVDVVLGGSFLQQFTTTLDYPAQRVILQCPPSSARGSAAPGCEVLPWCSREPDQSTACPGR